MPAWVVRITQRRNRRIKVKESDARDQKYLNAAIRTAEWWPTQSAAYPRRTRDRD